MKNIAVFTSGGDAPGMNAAVRAVVRTGIYHKKNVFGIYYGYEGMIDGKVEKLNKKDVANIIHRGGTILKTSRSDRFRTPEGRAKAYKVLQKHKIEGIVAIGGDGTFTGASVFSEEYNIPFIGIPGTIDNDIYGTDYTIGFDTAINTAIEAIDKIRDTADSHNRLFFIEVMGRHAGDIALHTSIGSGASFTFLPETDTTVEDLIKYLENAKKRQKLFNLVIVAEGNKSGNAMKIRKKLKKINEKYDSRVMIIGHIQRGGSPSTHDRVLASRFGFAAVNALIEGKSNIAVGLINGQIVDTSFNDAVTKTKGIDLEMIKMAEIISL